MANLQRIIRLVFALGERDGYTMPKSITFHRHSFKMPITTTKLSKIDPKRRRNERLQKKTASPEIYRDGQVLQDLTVRQPTSPSDMSCSSKRLQEKRWANTEGGKVSSRVQPVKRSRNFAEKRHQILPVSLATRYEPIVLNHTNSERLTSRPPEKIGPVIK